MRTDIEIMDIGPLPKREGDRAEGLLDGPFGRGLPESFLVLNTPAGFHTQGPHVALW